MKAIYTTKNSKLAVELDASTYKDLWKQLASFQEAFEEDKCGKCNSTHLRFVIRKSKDSKGKEYEYYELRCTECGAKLSFGLADDGSGSLYPKRFVTDDKGRTVKDEATGKSIPLGSKKNGWLKWNPETKKEE
jgi:hypothetical protein